MDTDRSRKPDFYQRVCCLGEEEGIWVEIRKCHLWQEAKSRVDFIRLASELGASPEFQSEFIRYWGSFYCHIGKFSEPKCFQLLVLPSRCPPDERLIFPKVGRATSRGVNINEGCGIETEKEEQDGSTSKRNFVVSNTSELHSNTPTLLGKYSKTSFLDTVRVFGNAMVGRNSQFYGLTRDEREQLGCIEYKALKLLSILVPAYLFVFQVIGSIAFGAFISAHRADTAYQNGVKPWYVFLKWDSVNRIDTFSQVAWCF